MSQNKTAYTKKFLILFLCFCLFSQSFSHFAFAAAENEDAQIQQSFAVSAELRQEAQQDAENLVAGINSIEAGDFSKVPIQDFDQFHLVNQRVEIYNGTKSEVYHLNDFQVEIPTVTLTSMKILFDHEKKELVFEAIRGADKSGANGTVVARQFISSLDVVGIVQDPEMLSFVDSKGHLHAIDLGFVNEQIFKSPVPVFQNLWQPKKDMNLKKGEVKLSYLTLGTKPFSESQLTDDAVLPKNKNNEIEFTAGDLAFEILTPQKSSSELIGVFSREVAYQRMIDGAKTLRWMALVASPNNDNIALAEDILKQIEKNKSLAEASDSSEEISPLVKSVLSQIKPEQLSALEQASERNQNLSERVRGRFSLKQWQKDYQSIRANMLKQKPDVDEQTIAEFWSQGIEAQKIQSPLLEKKQSQVAQILSEMKKKTDLKILAKVFAVGVAAYASLPFVYDAAVGIEQIKVISWAHEHFYPAILKDAVYRLPLLLSTVSLIAIWPAAVAISAATGKAFKTMAQKLEGSNSKMAQNIRDLAKNWGDLNSWQKITTSGMRLYAWLIYPYWRVLSTLLRQKTFFTALENGLNPMTLVTKDSLLGQKVNLTEDTRIGVNSIVASQEQLREKTNLNLKLQSALAEQKIKVENMAWAISSLVVSENYKIDPATLVMVSEGKLDLNRYKISDLLSDPDKKRQWEAVADQLMQDYAKISKNGVDLSKADPETFSEFYKKAKESAEKINALPEWKKQLLNLKIQFKKKSRQFLNGAIKLGKYDHEFLKKVYTNEFVSKQVQQEFSIDHLMVVGIVAFYGDRANLNNPGQLAADPHGLLWTSKEHWNDIFLNTFAHFFISGAQMTLVFQKPKPKSAENYGPKSDYLWVSQDRPQGFASGMLSWTKDVMNPLKADLGGIMLKRLMKRATTLTAGLTMSVGIRTLMMSGKLGFMNALVLAKSAWIFNFFAAQWFYGFIWDPIQAGNRLEGQRFAQQEAQLKEARQLLDSGQYAKGFEKMMALYFENNKKDLMKLELTVLKRITDTDLQNEILSKTSLKLDANSAQEKYYFGVLGYLAFALTEGDQEKIAEGQTALKKLLAQDPSLDEAALSQLSAESLLKFSVSNPPVYTRANNMITWLTTWIGAVGSTVLAIPLSVILTTNSLMANPYFIAKWAAISLSLYGVSYLLLSKTMNEKYLAFYNSQLKERFVFKVARGFGERISSTATKLGDVIYRNQKVKSGLGLQCEALFR